MAKRIKAPIQSFARKQKHRNICHWRWLLASSWRVRTRETTNEMKFNRQFAERRRRRRRSVQEESRAVLRFFFFRRSTALQRVPKLSSLYHPFGCSRAPRSVRSAANRYKSQESDIGKRMSPLIHKK